MDMFEEGFRGSSRFAFFELCLHSKKGPDARSGPAVAKTTIFTAPGIFPVSARKIMGTIRKF
jgi:hypothetical protein